jgi:hypothetical protein
MGDLLTYLTDNANTANAVAAVANVIIATVAVLIATLSIMVSWKALGHQVRHNKLSARPIPFLSLANYQDRLRVRIVNDGIGPLIIKRLTISDGDRSETDLISWMPALPAGRSWSTFMSRLENRSILPGTDLILLQLDGDVADETFAKFRDETRRVLQRLEGTIEYTDIYGDDFAPYLRKMDWFQVK